MEQKTLLKDTRIVALLAFLSCALWGSAFSAVKTGYALLGIRADAWADQLTFGGIRFAAAGIMALGFGSVCRKRMLLPNRSSLKKICLISLFQTVLQYFCYYIGLAHTTGVKASVLVGMNVFTAILIASLLLRIERLTVRSVIGCTVGFLGIILINLDGLSGGLHFQPLGDGLILLCTVASGFSSAFMKKLSGGEDPVLLSGWQFLLGGIVLCGIGLLGGGSVGTFSAGSFVLLLYLSLLGRAAMIVRRSKRVLPSLLVIGMASFITFQALFHMAINVGVFPVSGQPLPLISKGGTSIGVISLAFGVMLSVSRTIANYGNKKNKAEDTPIIEGLDAVNPTEIPPKNVWK